MQSIFSGWSWLSEAASSSQGLICTNDRARNEHLALRDVVLTNLMRLNLLTNWLHKQKHKQVYRNRSAGESQLNYSRNLSVKGEIPEISVKPTLCQFFSRSSFTYLCRADWVWLHITLVLWCSCIHLYSVWNNFYSRGKTLPTFLLIHCLLVAAFSDTILISNYTHT